MNEWSRCVYQGGSHSFRGEWMMGGKSTISCAFKAPLTFQIILWTVTLWDAHNHSGGTQDCNVVPTWQMKKILESVSGKLTNFHVLLKWRWKSRAYRWKVKAKTKAVDKRTAILILLVIFVLILLLQANTNPQTNLLTNRRQALLSHMVFCTRLKKRSSSVCTVIQVKVMRFAFQ